MMQKLQFEIEWLDGSQIQGPELAATFARVQIRVGESILTRAFDHETNAVRDFVLVPLYPLAEWIASNWWTLTNESENPASRRRHGFHGRHCLKAEREGYGFPRLELVSWGARTRIVSATDPMPRPPRPNRDLVHIEQTMKWVNTHELFETLADLIDQVLRRLASLGVNGTALEEEWDAVQSADDDESSFCRAAARLGWDPYAIDDRRRDQVLMLAERLGGLFDEAAPVLDPNDLEAGSRAIIDTLEEAKSNTLPVRCLGSLSKEVGGPEPDADLKPERAGSALAKRLRQALGAPAVPLRTWEELARTLDVDPQVIEAVLRQAGPLAKVPFVDAVVTATKDGLPGIAFRESSGRGLRLTFCRALAEIMAGSGPNAILTKAMTDRQERSHAFAAELLVPAAWLAEKISGPAADHRTVENLAAELDVAPRVVADQIATHGIARVRPYGWGSR